MNDDSSDTHDTQKTQRTRAEERTARESTLDYYIECYAEAWSAGQEKYAAGFMSLACELSFEEGVKP